MRTSRYLFRFGLLAVSLALVVVACSDSEELDGDGRNVPDAGADSTSEDVFAHQPDSGPDGEMDADASNDAAADVTEPERTCTDKGWCHTVVPDAQILNGVWGDGAGAVWTISQQGKILRWDGAGWVESYAATRPHPTPGNPPLVVPLLAIWGSGPTDIWVGGASAAPLFHGTGTSPSTITWTHVATPSAGNIESIWGTSATDAWAVTSNRVFHYSGPPSPDTEETDAGAEATGWAVVPITLLPNTRLKRVWGTGRDDVWIGGERGSGNNQETVLFHGRPNDSGEYVWVSEGQVPTQNIRMFNGGASLSRTQVVLLGSVNNAVTSYGYYVGHSDDDGATFTWTWHTFKSGRARLRGAWGTGPNDFWLAGELGRLRHWNGADWRVASIALDDAMPVIKVFNAIWGSGPDDIWVVGADIAIHKVPH